ncbi:MAG: hypothetical protein ACT4QF_15505 [Sporichthyaceae bacterium]
MSTEAIVWGLSANPALPGDLLDRLVDGASDPLLEYLADAVTLTRDQALRLASRSADAAVKLAHRGLVGVGDFADAPKPAVVFGLLEHGEVPAAWIEPILRHPDPWIRARLADTACRPAGAIAVLARDPDPAVVADAMNFARLGELIPALAQHRHAAVRSALASNEATPPDVLESFAGPGAADGLEECDACPGGSQDGSRWCDGGHEGAVAEIRKAVASNPNTPAHVCARLAVAGDDDELVRVGVATRTDLAPTVYEALAADPMPWVVSTVAANPAIGGELMTALADSPLHDVQRRLAENPAIDLALLARVVTGGKVRTVPLPRIALATEGEIELLARSEIAEMRMLVAERRDLPQILVDRLARDRDAKVLKSIAPNPNVRLDDLARMLADHGARVAVRVAENPSCTAEVLAAALGSGTHSRKVFRVVAAHPAATAELLIACFDDPRARPVAAANPRLPVALLLDLLTHEDPDVIEGAAANPALPREVIERLVEALC